MRPNPPTRHILITGCSGAGKSTLLLALANAGFSTVPEPGRRIIAEARAGDGSTLPWRDPEAFARRALQMAQHDRARAAQNQGPVFYDRGLVDAAVALRHLNGSPLVATHGPTRAYEKRVFLAEPWPELFQQDADRRHTLDSAIGEYDRIRFALDELGYTPHILPKVPVADRVADILTTLRDA